MDIRYLTPDYAVSPQITPEDVPALAAAGFTTVICNRPDPEIPADLHAATIRKAVEAAGMTFVLNPVIGGAITMDNADTQGAAIDAAAGKVFAYCASGNRSSIVWALSQAGRIATDDLIAAGTPYGYQIAVFRPQIEALAAARN
ncbi:MAG: TIGR01244 family sulfur transferase [Paracoccaceae bacterium]